MSDNALVIQVRADEPDAVLDGTRSAKNFLEVHAGATVDLVVQGRAVAGLARGAQVAAELPDFLTKMPTLTIYACDNALAAHDVDAADLADGIRTTPAGVAHCAQRQWEGWAYVRV